MQNVFKRVEQKYILNQKQYKALQELINKYFEKDFYYQSTIYNIYFDNDHNDLIINSLEKPIYKEKIRLRSYQTPKKDDYIFLEMKQKYKKIVYKRRVKLTIDEYHNYLNNRKFPQNNPQIMKEIDYYIHYYQAKPKIFVAYDRLSYYAKDDINFRITFDTNLRSRTDNLTLEDSNNNKKYFNTTKHIMEVKSQSTLPLWFVQELSKYHIYPRSFSKVGSIYTKKGR